jgi:hypothetical protein
MGELERAIRDALSRYLTGESSVEEFVDWIAQNAPEVEASTESRASELYYEIYLALSEHSRGDLTIDRVRERLTQLARIIVVDFEPSQSVRAVASSSSPEITHASVPSRMVIQPNTRSVAAGM